MTGDTSRPRRGWVVLCVVTTLLAALGWTLYVRSALSTTTPPATTPGPSQVDIGFAQAMSTHHQQAVDMAQIVLHGHGASGEIQSLASSIENTQLQEIGWMGGFLDLWGAPSQPSGSQMAWMTKNMSYYMDMSGGSSMPGMASQTELNQLATLSGSALDTRFVQLMLRHHLGGIEMALYAVQYAATPQVRALAKRMVLDQSQEVTLLQRLLQSYGATPLPFSTSQALKNSGALLGS
jgi:uncharacterized protein (DUF305 family)